MRSNIIDLKSLPHYKEIDGTAPPVIEEDILAVRGAVLGHVSRFQAGVEMYGLLDPKGSTLGGLLHLSEAQVRSLAHQLAGLVHKWDTEPRDLAAEVDLILSNSGHKSRARSSAGGFDVEVIGEGVFVYQAGRDGRMKEAPLLPVYAEALEAVGWTGPDGSKAPVVAAADGDRAAHVHAIPVPLKPNP